VDDLTHLNEEGRRLLRIVCNLQLLCNGEEEEFLSTNVPRRISNFREHFLTFLQGIFRFKRTAATHIFVIMISPEQRDRKPYALPVQCIPYAKMKHKTCRRLVNNLISEMAKRGMRVAGMLMVLLYFLHNIRIVINVGFTSNGEYNTLRCKGNTRPLSVLQLKANSRAKYGAMGVQKMMAMLSPKCMHLLLMKTYSAKSLFFKQQVSQEAVLLQSNQILPFPVVC